MSENHPIGYFVHHQGRGHAERCAAIVNALPQRRPVRIFCARGDIFPPLGDNATITVIPSLFEPDGSENPKRPVHVQVGARHPRQKRVGIADEARQCRDPEPLAYSRDLRRGVRP